MWRRLVRWVQPLASPTTPSSTAPFDVGRGGDTNVEIEPGRYRIPKSEWSAVDVTVYGHLYHESNLDETAEFYAVCSFLEQRGQ